MTPIADRLRSALADRYAVDREVGRGGMATVYLAHDVKHDRQVALKVLHPELAASLGPMNAATPKGMNITPKFIGRFFEPKVSAVIDAICPINPPKDMPTRETRSRPRASKVAVSHDAKSAVLQMGESGMLLLGCPMTSTA